MKKDPGVFLDHILECIDLIENYSEGIAEAEFMKSVSLQDMIIRRIEIIGEAVKNLPDDLKREYPEIPWRDIAGLRDIVVHQYFGLDLELIWDVVTRDIPDLKPAGRPQEEQEGTRRRSCQAGLPGRSAPGISSRDGKAHLKKDRRKSWILQSVIHLMSA